MPTLLQYHVSRQLGEGELMPANAACLFCGATSLAAVALVQAAPEIRLMKCDRCHASTVSRFPTPASLDRYYKDDFYAMVGGSSDGQKVTFGSSRRFGRHLASMVGASFAGARVDVLDFGGGDGALAASVARELLEKGSQGVAVTVVDYDDRLTSVQEERIWLRRLGSLDEATTQQYDFVMASAVLEHLTQPRETLMRLLELVRPGGRFYARTPCVASFMRLFALVGLKWDFEYPAHLHDLGQDFWESFVQRELQAQGWQLIASRPSIVESSFRDHPLTTVGAHVFKAPWRIFGKHYTLTGGWEVFLGKSPDHAAARQSSE